MMRQFTKIGRKQFGKCLKLATKHLKCYLSTNGTTIEIYRNKNKAIASYEELAIARARK